MPASRTMERGRVVKKKKAKKKVKKVKAKPAAKAKTAKKPAKKVTEKKLTASLAAAEQALETLSTVRAAWLHPGKDGVGITASDTTSDEYRAFYETGRVDALRGPRLAAAVAKKKAVKGGAVAQPMPPTLRDAYVAALEAGRGADGGQDEGATVLPTPAFVSYSVMRRHLWSRRRVVDGATGPVARAELQQQIQRLTKKLEKLRNDKLLVRARACVWGQAGEWAWASGRACDVVSVLACVRMCAWVPLWMCVCLCNGRLSRSATVRPC